MVVQGIDPFETFLLKIGFPKTTLGMIKLVQILNEFLDAKMVISMIPLHWTT